MTEYEIEVRRTSQDFDQSIPMACMGLAGETGEVIDMIKKYLYHKRDLDKSDLIKEFGDLKWYYTYLCLLFGISQEEIEKENIKKLRARYPNGFNFEDANRRADEDLLEAEEN